MTLEDAYKYADNKRNWGKTDSQLHRDVYTLNNQNIRDYYGIKEDVPLSEVEKYIAGLEEAKQRTDTKKSLLTKVTNTETNPSVKTAADAIMNFNYDPSRDAAYQAYVDMYNRQGQSAAKQTLNNLNAANMGRNSSYSAAATAQVQQAYAQKASEMIPTLAQQAYEKLMNNYSINKDMADSEYNRALTAYQTLADDYTRGLTDEQLRLNNRVAETELKWLDPNLELAYQQGLISYDDMVLQNQLNHKYGEQQILSSLYGGRSSGSGSSSSDLNYTRMDAVIDNINTKIKEAGYYNTLVEKGYIEDGSPLISGEKGTYVTSNKFSPETWAYVVAPVIANSGLTPAEMTYLVEKLGMQNAWATWRNASTN